MADRDAPGRQASSHRARSVIEVDFSVFSVSSVALLPLSVALNGGAV